MMMHHQVLILHTRLPYLVILEQPRPKIYRKTDNFSKFFKYRFFEVFNFLNIQNHIFAIAEYYEHNLNHFQVIFVSKTDNFKN